MEKRVDAGWLLSFYGAMLTDRQRTLLELYYGDDLSLAEIAALEGISRQAAHDAIRRGEHQLLALEEKLGLRARWDRITRGLRACRTEIENARLTEALARIDALLEAEEEQDGI